MQGGQALGRGRVHGRLPFDAAADPGGEGGTIDRHLGQGRGADQYDIGHPACGQRGGVVAGALRCDPETGSGCGPDDLGDLGGGPGYGDGGGPLVGQVPRGAELVVAGIAGQVDVASAEAAERLGGG